jgi:tetratricopeptide (TPR) repeat protein
MQRQSWAPFICCAAIAIAALAAYHNSFSGPFILDDAWNIEANPSIRHLWPPGPVLSPPPELGVGGRPVYNASFALNTALNGNRVGGYHAVNLAIHILAGLALFGVLRRTLRDGVAPAFAAALLWTVHPVLTGAVTYISERSELLMALFYLLTLYGFIRYAQPEKVELHPPPKRPADSRGWAILSIGACLLGMGSKEVMVTAPLAVLLYDRTFVAGTFGGALRRRRGYYLGLASTWLLLGALMAGTSGRRIGFGHGVGAWTYALTECGVVVRYLGLALWPRPLVLDYDLPLAHGIADVWPSAAVLVALAAAAAWALFGPARRRPGVQAAGFAGVFFFLTLAPTSSFIPVGAQPMAENRMYLPLAAIVALGLIGARALPRRLTAVAVAGLAAGLGVLTVRRNAVYSSGLSIWSDTVAKCPGSARAHANLGAALYRAGRKAEALAQVAEAARRNPGDPLTHLMLGNLLAEAGREGDAALQYREALRLDPGLQSAAERLSALSGDNGPRN